MVMILPTGGIFNWDMAEKIKTKGFLLLSPLSPFHVTNLICHLENFILHMANVILNLDNLILILDTLIS